MASRREQDINHILRRVGFGATQEEVDTYAQFAFGGATLLMARLLSFDQIADDVDDQIGTPGYVGITTRGEFQPAVNIADARQRWLFRMVHTQRPLQEKMALFWHNHFATGYSKIAGDARRRPTATRMHGGQAVGGSGRRARAARAAPRATRSATSATCSSPSRRIRRCSSGSTAARTRSAQPQENFGREMMELFTMGVGNYTETDVYAARARLHRLEPARRPAHAATAQHYAFVYNAGQHDTDRQGLQFRDLSGRRHGRFRRAPRRRACRTASI